MLDVDLIVEVKQLAGRGVPIREISRRLALSRNAVRRYLRGAAPGVYQQRRPRPQVVRDTIRDRVRDLLATEQAKATPRKQRLSAARIHRLLSEAQVQVALRTVSTLVAALRRELSDPLATTFLPLQYDPGPDAQVDFMEAEVDDTHDGRVKRHVLIVRLCCSRYAFRYAAPPRTDRGRRDPTPRSLSGLASRIEPQPIAGSALHAEGRSFAGMVAVWRRSSGRWR